MFLRNDQGYELAGGTAARPFVRLPGVPGARPAVRTPGLFGIDWGAIDWAPDLGAQIGTRDWWRGLATLTGLLATVWALNPGIRPLVGAAPAALDGAAPRGGGWSWWKRG